MNNIYINIQVEEPCKIQYCVVKERDLNYKVDPKLL